MRYRPLGSTGLQVSVLGLGCNRLGRVRPGRSRADMVRLLEQAFDAGITFFDTADVYVEGESERLLGEVFGRGRRQVVIATKVGRARRLPPGWHEPVQRVLRAAGRRLPWVRRAASGVAGQDFSPDHLRRSVDGSRRRLQTDRLDLLQLHNPPASLFRRDDTFETLERLTAEGAIRCYGVAWGEWRTPLISPLPPSVSTVQLPIADPDAVRDVLARASARGLGVIGNQPLKRGAWLQVDAAIRARDVLGAAVRLGTVSAVLAGTTSLDHLHENVEAVSALTGP